MYQVIRNRSGQDVQTACMYASGEQYTGEQYKGKQYTGEQYTG
jgi:hypothetical protein